jgi:hypothetical protein
MDLALALGRTVEELEDSLSDAEWNLWLRYSGRKGLPFRRLEMHLAQIALTAGIYAGQVRPETPLQTFLIDPPQLEDEDAEELEDEEREGEEDDDDAFGALPVDAIRYVPTPDKA